MACKNAIAADERINLLEGQIKQLQESHNRLSAYYHEFVKATIQTFKESAEEE